MDVHEGQRRAVRSTWSGLDMSNFGAYKEALQLRLVNMLWDDEQLRSDFFSDPKKVLAAEGVIDLPDSLHVEVLQEEDQVFRFVVPVSPPMEEAWVRYEQMASWYLFAVGWWWWTTREGRPQAAEKLRNGIQVAIIGKIWNDPAYREWILKDPKAALSSETGLTFPSRLAVEPLEDTPQLMHLVVPRRPTENAWANEANDVGAIFVAAHTWWWWLSGLRLAGPSPGTVSGWVS